MSDARILRAALMWLRNHYDVGGERDPAVIDRIDDVLANQNPTVADMELFRQLYPGDRYRSRP